MTYFNNDDWRVSCFAQMAAAVESALPMDQATSHCSRCKLTSYCGQACQRQAWKAHKLECVPG